VLDEPGTLGITFVSKPWCIVKTVHANTQAEKQGLQPGSTILSANGVQFNKLSHGERTRYLTEERPLKLSVLPPDQYQSHPVITNASIDELLWKFSLPMKSKIRELSILTKARSLKSSKSSECTSDSINGIVKSMNLLDVSCYHTHFHQYIHASFSSEVTPLHNFMFR
jgi:hypothetical protein